MKLSKEDTRKRHAILDWKSEKEYREGIIENPGVNEDIKASSIERIKEAEAEIKRLENK